MTLASVRSQRGSLFPSRQASEIQPHHPIEKIRPNGVQPIRLMRLVPGSKAQNQNDNF
jgi:hypothetical protein